MKRRLVEYSQVFTRGALFTILINTNSNLFETTIAFVLLESIWLVMPLFRMVYKSR
jgi:hypothetical protein